MNDTRPLVPAPRRAAPRRAALLLVAALPAAAFADDPALLADSKIARVTVYEDRALVERAATVNVPEGTSRIVFPRLPERFDANSLRGRSSSVRILSVDAERVHLGEAALPRVEEAKKAWDAAKRAVAAAEMALADAAAEIERLRSIRAASSDRASQQLGAGTEPNVDALEKLLSFVSRSSAAARIHVLEAQAEVDRAKEAEDLARRRFEEVRAAAGTSENRVVLTVTADTATEASFTVQYLVPDATWRPVYDVRVTEDFANANLELTAVVRQRTGEDWSGVPMELTTAQPSTGAAPPEPSPWIVDLWSPESRGLMASESAGAPAPAAPVLREARKGRGAADEVARADMDLDAFHGDVRRSGLVVAFQSLLPANVASSGQPSRVALGRWPLKPEVRWTAFPKATDKVFVTAKVRNGTGAPLPAGEARVFLGPDYVGPMAIADWGQAKQIDVGLGVDRQVEVARETLKQERSTEGVFSKDTVHARTYRITVKNHRDRSIDLRLLDQVPVSRDEDLTVELKDPSHVFAALPEREAEDNKARGVLEWRFPVAAAREADVRFSFEVRHPKSQTITGLE